MMKGKFIAKRSTSYILLPNERIEDMRCEKGEEWGNPNFIYLLQNVRIRNDRYTRKN